MIVSENNRIRKEHKEENKVFQIYRVFFSSTQGLTQFVVQSLYKKNIDGGNKNKTGYKFS